MPILENLGAPFISEAIKQVSSTNSEHFAYVPIFHVADRLGGWSTDGCSLVSASTNSRVLCQCSHLTNFALLLSPDVDTSEVSRLSLNLLGEWGCWAVVANFLQQGHVRNAILFLSLLLYFVCLQSLEVSSRIALLLSSAGLLMTIIAHLGLR